MPEEVLIEAASDSQATQTGTTLVAATDYTAAVANPLRDDLVISANVADVWVSFGTAAAVVDHGTVVRAGAEPLHITGWKGEVHIISSGAAVVGITETSYYTGERQPGADTFAPSGPSDNYYQRAVVTAPAPGTPYPPQ